MDVFQIVLTIVIFVVVSFFVILSVQLFFILKEFRKTVGKTNAILTDIENVSNEVKELAGEVGTGVKRIANVLDVVGFIKNKISGK